MHPLRNFLTGTRHLSTWYYNGIALSAVLIVNFIVCSCLAFRGSELSETVLICFGALALVGASWANVGLGPEIGWDRGGLPVVIVVTFIAAVLYSWVALLICGCIYICAGLAFSN